MPALTTLEVSAEQSSAGSTSTSVAYLVSSYPTLSMAWLLREVLQLRKMGLRIDVAAVNAPDRPLEQMAAAEVVEANSAYHLKAHGLKGALSAHLRTLARNPRGWLRGLRLTAQLAGVDAQALFFNLMYFTEGLMVGAWMQRRGQRHLHVHLASQGATVGLYVKRVFGCGLSITVHGPDEFYDIEGQYLAQKVEAADFVLCISSFARSQLMRLSEYRHWHKLLVSRLGVDASVFAARPHQANPQTFEILCVGRFTPSKGQHLLIDAAERLMARGHRVRLRLVGEGPDGVSLRQQAARLTGSAAVVFEGAVNQDRIRELYRSADIFCIPSFAEGIPVVLMEAMAMEIPCVSTHIAGIPELICDGLDGLLVPASDVDALTAALERLMEDAELRERLGRNGRRRVVEQYDLTRSVEALAAVFAERVDAGDASRAQSAR